MTYFSQSYNSNYSYQNSYNYQYQDNNTTPFGSLHDVDLPYTDSWHWEVPGGSYSGSYNTNSSGSAYGNLSSCSDTNFFQQLSQYFMGGCSASANANGSYAFASAGNGYAFAAAGNGASFAYSSSGNGSFAFAGSYSGTGSASGSGSYYDSLCNSLSGSYSGSANGSSNYSGYSSGSASGSGSYYESLLNSIASCYSGSANSSSNYSGYSSGSGSYYDSLCNSLSGSYSGSGSYYGNNLSLSGSMAGSYCQAAPVAANESGRIWGDPHFVGGDGGKYDVQGESGKTYNLLSDRGLQFNGTFESWKGGEATVVKESAINVGGPYGQSQVKFNADGKASVNGQQLQDGQSVRLADGGSATLSGNKLTVTTAEGYTIEQTSQDGYINADVKTGANGVAADGVLPHGLLGQSFDADNKARNGIGSQGQGAIDGDVTDYEVNNLNDISGRPGQNNNNYNQQSQQNYMMQMFMQFISMIFSMLGMQGQQNLNYN